MAYFYFNMVRVLLSYSNWKSGMIHVRELPLTDELIEDIMLENTEWRHIIVLYWSYLKLERNNRKLSHMFFHMLILARTAIFFSQIYQFLSPLNNSAFLDLRTYQV